MIATSLLKKIEELLDELKKTNNITVNYYSQVHAKISSLTDPKDLLPILEWIISSGKIKRLSKYNEFQQSAWDRMHVECSSMLDKLNIA